MEFSDLFGEGTTYANGVLSIPRANLEAMGLQSNAYNLVSITVALLLLIENYFVGSIVDYDGSIIIDDNGDSLGYDFNRQEPDINCEYQGKAVNQAQTKLFWYYQFSFYQLKP